MKLEEAEKNILFEYERKVNTNQQLAMSHNTIQIMFGALKRINDPIAERVIDPWIWRLVKSDSS